MVINEECPTMTVAEIQDEKMAGPLGLSAGPIEAPATRSSGTSAVSCRGLTKEFGSGETKIKVLRGVDLEVQSGSMTLLVGPSGCGKTTLISVMAATLEATSGEVWALGTNLTALR